ncbi:DUF3566 domain-containing protein [Nonomuraea terrae]|uniref:DUF3566 domain-containing protein n=1 Tax=Nonomuraea terrae TaxID=2530383 RepID=A0A4R4YT92_9ACTN|nr:DUF3566 domain-containing protein [Nonomuraea terrae]TDD48521.1 DUF3566 domain-containing protein [Nonomuraea terrae]
MSAQGGSARTKASGASGNGKQPQKPAETEMFDAVDDGKDTKPAQGRPAGPQEDGKRPMPPSQPQQGPQQAAPQQGPPQGPPSGPQRDGNDPVRMRPSLATEAPPAIELPKKKSSGGGGSRLPRKAHLVLRRVEPWSAMKFSFVVSLVCFVVLFVAVAVLYGVLSALGVFDSVVDLVNQLGQGEGGQNSIPIDIASWFEPVRILGYTALIGAVNVVLITALATLGAVIYNIASDLVGGVEVTFSEAE